MNVLGKILAFLVLGASIVFMALAGAVYTRHVNWRDRAEKTQQTLDAARAEMTNQTAQFEQERQRLNATTQEQTDRANRFEGLNGSLTAQIQQLTKDVETAKTEATQQRQLADIAGDESESRKAEVQRQRVVNSELQAKVNELTTSNRQLSDRVFTTERTMASMRETYKRRMNEFAVLQDELRRHELEADPAKIAASEAPPPRVHGIVMDTRAAERGGSEMIEISLGSDDGLAIGHQLHVFSDKDGGKYIGKIVIVSVDVDRAVGKVVDKSRNGVIQAGDNVTSQL